MYKRPNALATYNQVANLETNPIQQLVMLYNGAIKFLRLAATDIEAKDALAKAEHSSRALEIIGYLQSILDFERGQDVAPALDTLYSSVTAMILRASMKLDSQLMGRAADLLAPVCDAWAINARASRIEGGNKSAYASASSGASVSLNSRV
jgi:flagellar protein FliS